MSDNCSIKQWRFQHVYELAHMLLWLLLGPKACSSRMAKLLEPCSPTECAWPSVTQPDQHPHPSAHWACLAETPSTRNEPQANWCSIMWILKTTKMNINNKKELCPLQGKEQYFTLRGLKQREKKSRRFLKRTSNAALLQDRITWKNNGA